MTIVHLQKSGNRPFCATPAAEHAGFTSTVHTNGCVSEEDEIPELTDAKPILKLKRQRREAQPQARSDEGGRQHRVLKRPQLRSKGSGVAAASPLRKAADQEDRLLEALRRQSPETWDAERPVPLAVGIHAQIFPVAEPLGISRSAVRRFLTRWTSRPAYLDALSQPGAVRHDVDGSESVAVEQRHGRRARRRLEAPGRDGASADVATSAAESPPARALPPTRESSPSRR